MSELELLRKRRIRRFVAIVVALFALSAWQIAIAQPPAAPKAAPKEAATARPKAAQPGLPPGHPPVDQKMDPQRREQLRQLLEQRRKQRGEPQAAAPGQAEPAKPKKPKAPRDEHGHCLGQGPDDRPKDINLFHGWLGSKDELGTADDAWSKAVEPPPTKGSQDWWIWRLTPYPFRYDNHEDHCDRANQPVPLLANIVNLGALAFILVRFGRKPVSEALKNRKRTIMSEFDKAAEIKRSARARLDEYEDQLDHLDDKLESLREQYAAEGRHEEARVREAAAERHERMLGDAEFRVSQESKSARDELSREALEEALTAAETLVQKSLTAADHERIAADYLDDLAAALSATTIDRRGGTS